MYSHKNIAIILAISVLLILTVFNLQTNILIIGNNIMTPTYITTIQTAAGEAQIDYNALANLPTVATEEKDGLLSAADKKKLNSLNGSGSGSSSSNISLTIKKWTAADIQ